MISHSNRHGKVKTSATAESVFQIMKPNSSVPQGVGARCLLQRIPLWDSDSERERERERFQLSTFITDRRSTCRQGQVQVERDKYHVSRVVVTHDKYAGNWQPTCPGPGGMHVAFPQGGKTRQRHYRRCATAHSGPHAENRNLSKTEES